MPYCACANHVSKAMIEALFGGHFKKNAISMDKESLLFILVGKKHFLLAKLV